MSLYRIRSIVGFLTFTLGFTTSLILSACDHSASVGGTGGGGGNQGTRSNGSSTSSVSTSDAGRCAVGECVRAVTCVQACGGAVISTGCCPCASGTFDDISCRSVDAGSDAGFLCGAVECAPCAPGGMHVDDGTCCGRCETPCGDSALLANFPKCKAAMDKPSCEAAGGTWGTQKTCVCKTGQEGCPCNSPSSGCLGECVAPNAGGGIFDCTGVTTGHCSAESPASGCACYFHSVSDGGVAITAACIDP